MSEERKVLLEVDHLKKYFDTPRGMLHAVDDVTFQIEEGKTLGVVGESGCGKSTLGRTILRLLPSTDGKIIFNGEDITHVDSSRMLALRRDMQIIFQDPFSSLDPNELDGGRRQRIGVARALALNPKFIICDEPVSALDVSIQAQILNLMMDLKDSMGLTYIFITHDLSVVKHISDDILVLYLGKMVEMTDSDTLFDKPLHPYTKALLTAIPVPDASYKGKEAEVMKGEVTSPIEPPPGCRFAARCPLASERCFKESPEFKEVEPNHFVACHLYD